MGGTPAFLCTKKNSFCSAFLLCLLLLAQRASISNSFLYPSILGERATRLYFQTGNENNSAGGNYDGKQEQEVMKAWTCHGRNQKDLVDRLRQANIIQTLAVQKVMELVDRANYIPLNPYMDAPQGIGLGQTISAPHMHAHALEEIYPYLVGKENIQILDVGCGSGYLTATLARWFQSSSQDQQEAPSILSSRNSNNAGLARVFGIDVRQDLVNLTLTNIQKRDADLLESGILTVQMADGWKGLPAKAPFDAIHVGAAADGMPYSLVTQLKVGGVMIIPIGSQHQTQNLFKIERIRGNGSSSSIGNFDPKEYRITSLLGVRYVPLVKPDNN